MKQGRSTQFPQAERYQCGDTYDETGFGLGLYITRLLIERQGGSVGVESEPGEGARLWLRLPLAHAVASPR